MSKMISFIYNHKIYYCWNNLTLDKGCKKGFDSVHRHCPWRIRIWWNILELNPKGRYWQVALRWRTEKEVIVGKGQFECGNKKCKEKKDLKSWEVNFGYIEHGQKKNALVKLSKLFCNLFQVIMNGLL